jgi:hypothetical protein
MPRIILKNKVVNEQLNSKSGNVMRSQTFGLDLGNGYELPFSVGLGNKPANEPGEYDIDPASFALDQYGHLMLKKYVDLVRIEPHRSAAK